MSRHVNNAKWPQWVWTQIHYALQPYLFLHTSLSFMLCAQCQVKIMILTLGLVRIVATFVYITVNYPAQPTAWTSPFQEQNFYHVNCQVSKHVELWTNSYGSFRCYFTFFKSLMFNATGGYSTDPYEVQRSVACMHQQHSEFKEGSCKTKCVYLRTTIPQKANSGFLQTLHNLTKEICHQKL